jgi:hypothetical protein
MLKEEEVREGDPPKERGGVGATLRSLLLELSRLWIFCLQPLSLLWNLILAAFELK